MSSASMIPPSLPPLTGQTPTGAETGSAKNLQLGQVFLAKVLRVYQNGSYLVDLHGRQHVVDSTIPLRQEEVFRGKVVGLDEKIVLEKMVDAEAMRAGEAEPALKFDWGAKDLAADLQAFVRHHQSAFDGRIWNTLIRAASRTSYPQLVLSASVFLHKLGLPVSAELAVNLARHLAGDVQLRSLLKNDALHLQTDIATAQAVMQSSEASKMVAEYLKKKSEDSSDYARAILKQLKAQEQSSNSELQSADHDARNFKDDSEQAAFQWLMNAQLGGAVSHRLVVVPFVLGGKLVELEMSLFDQNENTGTPSELKSRVIHISLNMEHLGKINAVINAVNKNLRVQFSSDSEAGLQMLASHNQHLTTQLQNLSYQVDELGYSVARAASDMVVRPIMDLVSNADSLSMLA